MFQAYAAYNDTVLYSNNACTNVRKWWPGIVMDKNDCISNSCILKAHQQMWSIVGLEWEAFYEMDAHQLDEKLAHSQAWHQTTLKTEVMLMSLHH
jgi:hypothetical protein